MGRLSKAYFPGPKQSSFKLSPYAIRFVEDVYMGIVPCRRNGKCPYVIGLSKKDEELSKELVKFLNMGYRHHISLDETLREVIENLSQYLATFGEAYLEIVHENSKSTDDIKDKRLELLPWGRVIKVSGYYVQLVPIRSWQRKEKKFYAIPSDRIWHIKLPRKLGTPRRHRKMLKRLNALSEFELKFTYKYSALDDSTKYDFMAHRRFNNIALEEVTSYWGGIPSLGRIEGTTEYHFIVNGLKFAYSQALLREHIISEMNRMLLMLGVKNSLNIEGLRLAADIEDAIKKLERGEIGFDEAVDAGIKQSEDAGS